MRKLSQFDNSHHRISNHHKVLQTESHGATDWNLILLTKYKDMATMEANEARENALYRRLGQRRETKAGLPGTPRNS